MEAEKKWEAVSVSLLQLDYYYFVSTPIDSGTRGRYGIPGHWVTGPSWGAGAGAKAAGGPTESVKARYAPRVLVNARTEASATRLPLSRSLTTTLTKETVDPDLVTRPSKTMVSPSRATETKLTLDF